LKGVDIMPKVSTNISIDAEIKVKAQQLFNELGLDLSTAINIFLRQALYKNGFPFDIKLDFPNEETLKAIESAENREDVYGPFDTVDDLMEALNA